MKFINTKAHGILDYLVGILLIVAPWALHFYANGPETWIPVAMGIAVIFFSLLTDYEFGAFKRIPMRVHLGIDFMVGLFLAASPWLFGFHGYVYMPHLIVGTAIILLVFFSSAKPYAKTRTVGYPPSGTQGP